MSKGKKPQGMGTSHISLSASEAGYLNEMLKRETICRNKFRTDHLLYTRAPNPLMGESNLMEINEYLVRYPLDKAENDTNNTNNETAIMEYENKIAKKMHDLAILKKERALVKSQLRTAALDISLNPLKREMALKELKPVDTSLLKDYYTRNGIVEFKQKTKSGIQF